MFVKLMRFSSHRYSMSRSCLAALPLEFERDTNVITEQKVVLHVNDVEVVVLIFLPQLLQDPELLLSLAVISVHNEAMAHDLMT